MLSAMEAAKTSIEFESYIYAASPIGGRFREGLVGYLENAPAAAGRPGNDDAQQKGDEVRARRAYAANTARVAELVGGAFVSAC